MGPQLAAEEVIKRIYKSWQWSDKKITVAKATVLGLQAAGLLNQQDIDDDVIYAFLDNVTVDKLKQGKPIL